MKKKIILILALILCPCLMAGCGSKTVKIDMEPYIVASYTGFNGNATAHFDIDLSGFESEAMSKWKDDGQYWSKLGDLAALELTFRFEPSTAENLKNGDKVTVTMTYDENVAKTCGYSLTGTTKKITVEGLSDAIMIDPFDDEIFGIGEAGEGKPVRIIFSGISPNINTDKSVNYTDITYDVDSYWGVVANGDVVTVTATLKDYVANQGYALSRTELTIPIEGFDYYVDDLSQLTTEALREIGEKAYQESVRLASSNLVGDASLTVYPSYFGNTYENIHVGDMAILMVQDGGWNSYNYLYVPVYKDIVGEDGTRWNNVFTYYIFKDIVAHPDGTITYSDYIDASGAYTNMDIAYEKCLSPYAETYKFIDVPMP